MSADGVLKKRARTRGQCLGFTMSSDGDTGCLLAVLAASVPSNGRILELGTGLGFDTGSLVQGLRQCDDVRITTIEGDEPTVAA